MIPDQLLKLGYRVDLVPVEFRNYCVLEMCGYEIFRCNISNLSFNTSCAPDPVCARAVAAVESASLRLQRANTYLWLRDYLAEESIYLACTISDARCDTVFHPRLTPYHHGDLKVSSAHGSEKSALLISVLFHVHVKRSSYETNSGPKRTGSPKWNPQPSQHPSKIASSAAGY
ncbi:unnamed protein product [Plutella xylostella]|uniref:(diamondback moth) hypothetical protein n=1 Tax=Plutella xylostella TaxID=51655 RepID=A0A8S4EK08_PLUXY|nr:unnamed protein product [Plutella xylostella]